VTAPNQNMLCNERQLNPPRNSAWMVSDLLRVADVDGLIVVMDLATSAFYVLDEDASIMWTELRKAQGSVAEAKDALQGDGPARRLAGQFDEFVADCEARGFLNSGSRPAARVRQRAHWPRRSRGRSLLTVRAWLSMLRMDIAVRRRGFASVYERLACHAGGHLDRVDPRHVQSARHAFLKAENFYLRRNAPNDCLPRSLSLCAFMRHLGIPAVHHIGARRFPAFGAHAWGEYDGEPILDRPAITSGYTRIATA
jgi:Transglutaminase-like superfamily